MTSTSITGSSDALRAALDAALTQSGASLLALSRRAPLLLVFLRHFG
jgi:hypothetical protein